MSPAFNSYREVLGDLGVGVRTARRVKRGRNTHWIVGTDSGHVVLRKYPGNVSMLEVDYEIGVVQHLAKCGWPVPVPIAAPVERPDGIWCLLPYLPGRSPAPRSSAAIAAEQQRRGRLLARLHADLAPLTTLGQRTGWRRTDEGLFERPGRRSPEEVFREHAKTDPEAARILLSYETQARERLAELVEHAPAPAVIHGDVTPWNVRYAAGKLSGLFDFDLTHLDLRVADFALSWRGRHGGVLDGYVSVASLEEVERELIVPVYWAWMIAGAVLDIENGNGNPEWAITHLQRQPVDRPPI